MKGAEPHSLGGVADHRFEPLAHLARRLVGKGDGEKFGRQRAPGSEGIGQPGSQNPGLAGTRAGKHQHRAVDRLDGATLRVVQAGEINGLGA